MALIHPLRIGAAVVDATHLSLQLSYALSGVRGRREYIDAANESLRSLIPADSLGWVGIQVATGATRLVGTDGSDRAEIVKAVRRSAPKHPMLLSYMATRASIEPRRMSDVIGWREWRSHEVYRELFVPLGASEQLTIMTQTATTGAHSELHAWALHRAGHPFTDDELEIAIRLQPVMMTLNRLSMLAPERESHLDTGPGGEQITQRESDVLRLLSQGFTAGEIGQINRISVRTVHKHLEHLYEKLGSHNRVEALTRAASYGLL
jgi:DNA-binding CsgD family transcriptional regulator